MTLPYEVTQALSIPGEAYDGEGNATIVVTGGSYGEGTWVLTAISVHLPPEEAEAIGAIETDEAPRRPDRALEAAHDWVRKHCAETGLSLQEFKDLNSTYDSDAAPFFCSGAFTITHRTVA